MDGALDHGLEGQGLWEICQSSQVEDLNARVVVLGLNCPGLGINSGVAVDETETVGRMAIVSDQVELHRAFRGKAAARHDGESSGVAILEGNKDAAGGNGGSGNSARRFDAAQRQDSWPEIVELGEDALQPQQGLAGGFDLLDGRHAAFVWKMAGVIEAGKGVEVQTAADRIGAGFNSNDFAHELKSRTMGKIRLYRIWHVGRPPFLYIAILIQKAAPFQGRRYRSVTCYLSRSVEGIAEGEGFFEGTGLEGGEVRLVFQF
ncbi:MAG: hypothetical protein HW405_245 [Candidatus Berkelbacteria bacterium]|nr:hypothetical protein [Candidatus Berkelbacteria bacterium]